MENLKTGDVVQLASGGPLMTVNGIIGDGKNPLSNELIQRLKKVGFNDGDIYCQRFNGDEIRFSTFKRNMLKVIEMGKREEMKTGYVVRLASGGPEMTVDGMIGDSKNPLSNESDLKKAGFIDGDIHCKWFNYDEIRFAAFKQNMLKVIYCYVQ